MLLRYFYDHKLAHASYMVGCQASGEAAVIDPGRNIEPYIDAAEQNGMRIIAAIETHIHADFVSGLRELGHRMGAKLYVSDEGDQDWKYRYVSEYNHKLLKHGDSWKIGNIIFEAIHTPGHTPEHLSFKITDSASADKPMGVFTGDFVFVGDIGRPDLLEEAAGIKNTKIEAARQMFRSVQTFKDLPGYLQIWPAHGAGSACGKALGAIPSTTLGYEKMFNWAFTIDDEEKFIETLLEGQPAPPKYFAEMKRVNKEGPALIESLPEIEKLEPQKLQNLIDTNAWIIDTRDQKAYVRRHFVGTTGIPLTKSFNTYAGWVVPYGKPIYLIIDESRVDEAVYDLRYVGLDQIAGFFTPDILDRAPKESSRLRLIRPDKVIEDVKNDKIKIIDVRNESEFVTGHLPGSENIPLGKLQQSIGQIKNDDQNVLLICRSGGRSFVAATLLRSYGIKNVINLAGGIEAWKSAKYPVHKPSDLHRAA